MHKWESHFSLSLILPPPDTDENFDITDSENSAGVHASSGGVHESESGGVKGVPIKSHKGTKLVTEALSVSSGHHETSSTSSNGALLRLDASRRPLPHDDSRDSAAAAGQPGTGIMSPPGPAVPIDPFAAALVSTSFTGPMSGDISIFQVYRVTRKTPQKINVT